MEYEEYISTASSSSNEQLPSSQTTTPVLVLNSSACSPLAAASSEVPVVTSAKRKAGRKKFRETRHPVYRGVRERNGGKWVCELREPQKKTRIWLGTYATPEMAARAHDVAAIALRGDTAALNFSDSAWALPRPMSTTPEDIRCAATKAASMFRPPSLLSPTAGPSPCTSRASRAIDDVRIRDGEDDVAVAEAACTPPAPSVFVDEDALLNMSELVDDMAKGLLMTPPAMQKGFDWDTMDCNVDWSLWTD